MVKTSFRLGEVEFRNRVLVASGTFGYGDDLDELVDIREVGGIVTKSLSLNPREGNPPPRIVESACGMLNSIGLANIGVQELISKKLPRLRKIGTVIVANIAASSVKEYCDVLSLLEEQEGVDAYEINVSCPNVKEGGLSFGASSSMTGRITTELRRLTKRPLIMKLTPNVTHISEFARAVEDCGADAISAVNTVVGMAIDVRTRKPRLSTISGGLSGPAIKPIALAKVYECAQVVQIPIIGIGGIMTSDDALEFLLVGASAIQVGTANYVNPSAGVIIADGIRKFCEEQNIDDVGALVGTLESDKEISVIHSWL